MSEKNEKALLEFYKSLYDEENARSIYFDKIIQYPTTILLVIIGAVVYCINKYYPEGLECSIFMDWVFNGFLLLFFLSIVFTGYFLYTVFYRVLRKYWYLPHTKDIHRYIKDVFRFYYKQSNFNEKQERVSDSEIKTCETINKRLLQYYIDLTDDNQRENDKRANNYAYARLMISINLILLIFISVISFLN